MKVLRVCIVILVLAPAAAVSAEKPSEIFPAEVFAFLHKVRPNVTQFQTVQQKMTRTSCNAQQFSWWCGDMDSPDDSKYGVCCKSTERCAHNANGHAYCRD